MKEATGIERRAAGVLKAFLGTIPQLSIAHITVVGETGEADKLIVAEDELNNPKLWLAV